jgi:hypothetical protein
MQDQPILAPWTPILVEYVRSGSGVWTFASDWTYRMVSYPSPPFFSFLTKVEQASPPRLYMGHEPFPSLMCFLLLSLFLWRLASCHHYHPILILTLQPFCPSAFPISSIYPSNPTSLSLSFIKYCMGPAGFRVFIDLFFFYCSFLCLLLSLFGFGFP